MAGSDIAFVHAKVVEGVPTGHIAAMLGVPAVDVERYASLRLEAIEATLPLIPAPRRVPEPTVVLSLWRGLIQRDVAPFTMAVLLRHVAEDYHVSISDLLGTSRVAKIARPRQDFMWRCRQQKDEHGKSRFSLPQIGRFLGMDHTTVLHGVRAHEARLAVTDA